MGKKTFTSLSFDFSISFFHYVQTDTAVFKVIQTLDVLSLFSAYQPIEKTDFCMNNMKSLSTSC
ncbi:MAG: hypothetical protein ACLUOD_16975, partial [[Clostridium] innocuum]